MLSEHISGDTASAAAIRSSTVMMTLPPVVMLMIASQLCLMRGRNCMNTAGSGEGRPSGLRVALPRIINHHASFKREDLPAEALDDQAPESLRRLQHHDDRHDPQHEQIDRAEIGERLAQEEEDDRADDRALDASDPADHGDEDHERGPVIDAEGGIRRNPQLLQKDE